VIVAAALAGPRAPHTPFSTGNPFHAIVTATTLRYRSYRDSQTPLPES
jgi:hypothetical protein